MYSILFTTVHVYKWPIANFLVGWRGRNERTHLEGIFPRTYVSVTEEKPIIHSPQPISYNNMPLEISQSGTSSHGKVPSKFEENGKKFGKKMGNAGKFSLFQTAYSISQFNLLLFTGQLFSVLAPPSAQISLTASSNPIVCIPLHIFRQKVKLYLLPCTCAVICWDFFLLFIFLEFNSEQSGINIPARIGVTLLDGVLTVGNHLILYFCVGPAKGPNIWPVSSGAYEPNHRERNHISHSNFYSHTHINPEQAGKPWNCLDLLTPVLFITLRSMELTIIPWHILPPRAYRNDKPGKATYRHTTHG